MFPLPFTAPFEGVEGGASGTGGGMTDGVDTGAVEEVGVTVAVESPSLERVPSEDISLKR